MLTIPVGYGYNRCALRYWRIRVTLQSYFYIALIITSIALIASVILQNKGVGLGGLSGAETSNVFSTRRGIEKTLFWITIILSIVFFVLTLVTIFIGKTA